MVKDLTLENAAQDLFESFKTQIVSDKSEYVRNYVKNQAKACDIVGIFVDKEEYSSIQNTIIEKVLPLYEKYQQECKNIEEKTHPKHIWKYVLGAIVAIETVELVLTKGRSLKAGYFIKTLPLEAIFGGAVYGISRIYGKNKIKSAKKSFFNAVKDLSQKLETERTYSLIKEEDKFLELEENNLLTKYDSASQFWNDYRRIKEQDPTSSKEFSKIGIEKFKEFVIPHLSGNLSEKERAERFKHLFVAAHKYFMDKNPDYINTQI